MSVENVDEHLISSKGLSKILGVSVNTLTAWRIRDKKAGKAPRIPFFKIANKIRYKLVDVKEFIRKHE